MRFLIDECLHESLVGLAQAVGFETTHVNYLGLSGRPDWALAERIMKDEFTFVTNNRADFIRLFGKIHLHPGLIVLVPNVVPSLQRALF
jgi:predicted nuclease of predicted toxin-antitoxin system